MMLTGQHGGSEYEYASSDAGSYDDDDEGEGSDYEDEEGAGNALDEDEEVADADGAAADLNPDLDPARYEDDEAFARALQDAEERDVTGRLMALAGIGDWRAMEQDEDEEVEEEDDGDGDDQQDAWEDVDPDEYSYEELIALGEVVGTESKGLSADTIASLPSVTYQAQDKQEGNMEQCVICRVEFDEGEPLVALPCKHSYHSECINQWLQLNKVKPPLIF
ncbi:E3 ubiquitin ligase BIG BROTHER-related [Dichanthelium oligosanthes]|uniref:E3 ubiquitin ligase BIG BROTHER-related n=1 Tax=Dichanthelium oligosanthes TaxID=888268 RepID=A0A1E5VV07_9POAL|nr:E3 ubiquitin ligase BIG BROTHER-related [Dichanthelium oligosanthes]